MDEVVSRYLVLGPASYRDQTGEAVRIIYATRTASTLAVDEQTAIALAAGDAAGISEEARQELRDSLAVVSADEDEFHAVLARQRSAAADPSLLKYAVLPTSYCNMACSYCGQSHTAGVMSRSHRDAVRARICAGIERPTTRVVEVGWFGGEPLVGLGIIRDLSRSFIDAADRRGVSYTAKMPTNGSLLTVDKLRVLHDECRVRHLEITLDGPAHIHDHHRPLKSGKGSFHHIVGVLSQALGMAELEGIRFTLRTNVDVDDRDHVSEYIDYMASLGSFANERVSFYFAPVHSWSNDVSAIQLSHQDFARLEAGWLKEMSRRGLNIPTLPSEPKDVVCKAVTPFGEIVSSSGRVFSCSELPLVRAEENDASALGRVDDPALPPYRPSGPFDGWHNLVERYETPCSECVFFPTCGGSCPKLWREGYEPCPSYRFNINEMFDLIAIRSGLVPVSPERAAPATHFARLPDQ